MPLPFIGKFKGFRLICLQKRFVDASLKTHLKTSKEAPISNNRIHLTSNTLKLKYDSLDIHIDNKLANSFRMSPKSLISFKSYF